MTTPQEVMHAAVQPYWAQTERVLSPTDWTHLFSDLTAALTHAGHLTEGQAA